MYKMFMVACTVCVCVCQLLLLYVFMFTCPLFQNYFFPNHFQLFREVRIMKYLDHPNIGRSSVVTTEATHMPQHIILRTQPPHSNSAMYSMSNIRQSLCT